MRSCAAGGSCRSSSGERRRSVSAGLVGGRGLCALEVVPDGVEAPAERVVHERLNALGGEVGEGLVDEVGEREP